MRPEFLDMSRHIFPPKTCNPCLNRVRWVECMLWLRRCLFPGSPIQGRHFSMTLLVNLLPCLAGSRASEPTIVAFHLSTEIQLVQPYLTLKINLPFQGNAQIGHPPEFFLLMIAWCLCRSVVDSSHKCFPTPPIATTDQRTLCWSSAPQSAECRNRTAVPVRHVGKSRSFVRHTCASLKRTCIEIHR